MNHPSVTVIIPAYNQEAYVGEAIRSVLATSVEGVTVCVINDGSTDGTDAAIRPFISEDSEAYDKRVRYVERENGGKSAALNDVMTAVEGEYVTILDADDRLSPGSLERRMVAIRRDRNVDVVVGGFEVVKNGDVVGTRMGPETTNCAALSRKFFLSYKTPFHLNACLMHRNLFRRVGLFDTRLRRCQDIDYAIRMLALEPSIAVVDEPVYAYRKHRDEPTDRLRIRIQTAKYRAMTYWKNARPGMKVPSALWAVVLDLLKAGYELGGTYNN